MRVSFPAPNIALQIFTDLQVIETRTLGSFFRCGENH